MVKIPPANAGDIRDAGSIPGLGRSPELVNGNSVQYSCLENPRDRRAQQATVHGAAKSQTPEDLLDPGIEPASLANPALAGRVFTTMPQGGGDGI